MERMSLRHFFDQRVPILIFALLLISLLIASTGHASPQYYIKTEQRAENTNAKYYMTGSGGVYISGNFYRDIRELVNSQPITVNREETVTFVYGTNHAARGTSYITTAGEAAPGLLKGRAVADSKYEYNNPGINSTTAFVTSRFLLDDLLFINTSNPTETGKIDVTLNFRLTGSFQNDNLSNSAETFHLLYYHDTTQTWNGAGYFTADGNSSYGWPLFANLPSYTNIDGVFSLTIEDLSYGTPVSFGLEMYLWASAFASMNPTEKTNIADFILAFVTNQPLFTLPDGFTVNSASGGIADNRFTGGSPVPLPSSFMLLLSGLLGIKVLRRR